MYTPPDQSEKSSSTFYPGPLQVIDTPIDSPGLRMKRLDLIKSGSSGNKYYKQKYFLQDGLTQGRTVIVSKGGMFSNHLAALSDVCLVLGIKLIAVIRSHTPDELNPAIQRLRANGNEILYVTPEVYRSFHADASEERFPGALFIPEGGLSVEGIQGTAEIASEFDEAHLTHVIVAGGTMGTACGLVSSLPPSVKLIIVPAWKGCTNSYFNEVLNTYTILPSCAWELWPQYHFGGFGRFNQQLIDYMYNFTSGTGIPLDPVYTGKVMFAISDQIEAGYFNTSDSIVAIHTGGLQGLDGYRYRFPEAWSNYCQLVRH